MAEAGLNDELRTLAARISSAQGPGLFPAMAQYLASLLRASEVLIGEAADQRHARTLGVCLQGAVQPNYTFALAGTPCEALVQPEIQELPQQGETLAQTGTAPAGESGYFGMPLQAGSGKLVGFVCARGDGLTISDTSIV